MNQSCPKSPGLFSIYINATADQWQKNIQLFRI